MSTSRLQIKENRQFLAPDLAAGATMATSVRSFFLATNAASLTRNNYKAVNEFSLCVISGGLEFLTCLFGQRPWNWEALSGQRSFPSSDWPNLILQGRPSRHHRCC